MFVLIIAAGCAAGPSPSAESGAGPGSAAKITGLTWQWEGTRYSNDTEAVPPDSTNYNLMLNPDGTISVKADCNMAGGTWEAEGSRITITVTHSTMAMCPPESLDTVFLKELGQAAIYFLRDQNLYLDLPYDTGTMKFKPRDS